MFNKTQNWQKSGNIGHISSQLQHTREVYYRGLERLQSAYRQAKQQAKDQAERKRKNIKGQRDALKAQLAEAQWRETQAYARLSWSDCCYYEDPARCEHAPLYYAAMNYRVQIQQQLSMLTESYHAVEVAYIDGSHICAYTLEMQNKEREAERVLEDARGKLSNLEFEQKESESVLNSKLFDLERIATDIKVFHSGEWDGVEELTILKQAKEEAEERVNLFLNEKSELENALWFEQEELERFRMDKEHEIELLSQELHESIDDDIDDATLECLAYKKLTAIGLFRHSQIGYPPCTSSKRMINDQDLEDLARKELLIEKQKNGQQKGHGFLNHVPDIVGHAVAHTVGHVIGHTLAGGLGAAIGGGIGAALYPTSLGRDDIPPTESELNGYMTVGELRQQGAQISDENISQAIRVQL